MANRFVQAPRFGGPYRRGQPTLAVVHSMECPAIPGIAYKLATGFIQGSKVSPHHMTDPVETIDMVRPGIIGWHCGNGNPVGVGLEVTGYAAWTFQQWTTGDAFAAVRLDAKQAAAVAKHYGIPLRWLSLNQIRAGESGFCTHADISATLGGTNHWDPGPGFPFAIFMRMVQQWAGGGATAGPDAKPLTPSTAETVGGAEPEEDDMPYTPEQLVEHVKYGVERALEAGKLGQRIAALEAKLDSLPVAVWTHPLDGSNNGAALLSAAAANAAARNPGN
jgi:hypothetical protein